MKRFGRRCCNYATRIKPTSSAVIDFDAVFIGAGVVGLASAYSFLNKITTRNTIAVLDRNAFIGYETSSRNSEVYSC